MGSLKEMLVEVESEWPPNPNRHFIPDDRLERLITENQVYIELAKIHPDYSLDCVRWTCSMARKIFVILTYISKERSIFDFFNERITDADLPFTRSSSSSSPVDSGFALYRKDHGVCAKSDHQSCRIHAMVSWSQSELRAFYRDQWMVQAPVFREISVGQVPHLDLDDDCILPFVEDHEGQQDPSKSSAYSDAWAVRIHPAHQLLYQSTDPHVQNPLLVVKRLSSLNSNEDVRGTLLARGRELSIQLLATYNFKGHCHLLLRGIRDDSDSYQWQEYVAVIVKRLMNLIPKIQVLKIDAASTPIRPVLSIDGGGVRGLCSLLILDAIMEEVKQLELSRNPKSTDDSPRLPCDYFGLAGGTSTGGLIVIMLFRLCMNLKDVIEEYRRLSPKIFNSGMLKYVGGNAVKALLGRPWFKAEVFKVAVQGIVTKYLPEKDSISSDVDISNALLLPSMSVNQQDVSKMFVCALKVDDDSTVRFRNYAQPGEPPPAFGECTIWEAALATSAAPFYFPTAKVNGTKFWDGGLENNNPIDQVWAEKGPARPECVISLGTGFSVPIRGRTIIPALGKARKILDNLTKVEGRHRDFEEKMKNENPKYYFRFNPSMANDNIGLADYQKLDVLEAHTQNFLKREKVREDIRLCAEFLVGQQTERYSN